MQTTTESQPIADVREITACRLCGSRDLWPFFFLGKQPLANDLVPPNELDRDDFRAPLTSCAATPAATSNSCIRSRRRDCFQTTAFNRGSPRAGTNTAR